MPEHAKPPSRPLTGVLERSAAVALLLCLWACASVPTADGERLKVTSLEFREYVERVFREQNRVADEVAFALDEPGAHAELAAAEQGMLAACAGVNELATARRDRRQLGMRSSLRAARTVPECERAAAAAAARLEQGP